ncbi:MAG: hypothetical protein KDE14_16190 [Rhodobacteraceae bacterium]|nr:hypothetical protein [Paracoccaceae bacterium]
MNAISKPTSRVALRLFVTGATPSAERAKACIAQVREDLRKQCVTVDVQVIDVLSNPDAAAIDDVFATPTVIRVSPAPGRRLFGDLSSPEMVMIGLQILPETVPA